MASDHKKPIHHLAHDYVLIRSLLVSLLAVLFAGLGLNSFISFFKEHHLPLDASSIGADWEHLEWYGDMELLRKPIPGTQLFSHKVVSTVGLPFNEILKVFRDTPESVSWVKDLVESEEWHKSKAHHDGNKFVEQATLRQRYKFPLPGIYDREFLVQRTLTTEEAPDGSGRTSVTAEYISYEEEDSKYPLCHRCVRGENLGSKWKFTSLDEGSSTKVEVEIAVDPHIATLSPFFINSFQKRWPTATLHGLFGTVRHNLHRESDIPLRNVFHSLFPLWK